MRKGRLLVIRTHHDQGTAYCSYEAVHREDCDEEGVVMNPSCGCPEWSTNIEVPLDEVEAELGTLPEGEQEPWPETHATGRVEYTYEDARITGVLGFWRFEPHERPYDE